MEKIKISIYAIIGDSLCIAAEDGNKVYEQIKTALLKKKKVNISFLNIEMLTSAFLNTAIGRIYGEFEDKYIKSSLTVSDISDEDKLLLKRVIETAKNYYKDPDQFEKSIKKIMEA